MTDVVRQVLLAQLDEDRGGPPVVRAQLAQLTHDQLVSVEIFRERLTTALRMENRRRDRGHAISWHTRRRQT